MNCPHCNGELVPEPGGTGKYLCYNCKTRFNMSTAPSQKPQNDSYDPFAGLDSTPNAPTGSMYQPPAAPTPASSPRNMVTPQPSGQPGVPLPKGMAIAALILGIVSIVTCLIPLFSTLIGIAGIVVGILAIRKASRNLASGKGMAIAGTICAGIGTVLSALLLVFSLMVIGAVSDELTSEGLDMDYSYSYDDDYDYDELENMLDDLYSDSNISTDSDLYSNTNTNMSGESPAVTPPAVETQSPADIATPTGGWEDLTFTVDGQNFQLGVSKVSELAAVGITLDDTAGFIVNPNQGMPLVAVTIASAPNTTATISVANATDTACDIADAIVTGFNVAVHNDSIPNISVCGIPFGSPITDVQPALGEPDDTFQGDGGYASVDYQSKKFDKRLRFSAVDGQINDVAMSLYL